MREEWSPTLQRVVMSGGDSRVAAVRPSPLGAAVTPSVLHLNQNTKPYHKHHVYVLLHVVNEKLNFIALILKLSSNLFLVQVFFRSPNYFHSS